MLFLFKNTANEQIEIFSILFSIMIRWNCSIFIKYLFHVKTKSMLNSPKNFVSKIIVPAIFVTIVTFPSCKKTKLLRQVVLKEVISLRIYLLKLKAVLRVTSVIKLLL